MKVIETSRLSLRLVALSDLENIHRLLYADHEVAIPWMGHVQSLAEVSAPNGSRHKRTFSIRGPFAAFADGPRSIRSADRSSARSSFQIDEATRRPDPEF